ncbi:hypothetical protein LTR66_011552 [Elasticomyces elasticus]|nr:hypothetical protein LTR66_011552 [Elasticomyces elasticus]
MTLSSQPPLASTTSNVPQRRGSRVKHIESESLQQDSKGKEIESESTLPQTVVTTVTTASAFPQSTLTIRRRSTRANPAPEDSLPQLSGAEMPFFHRDGSQRLYESIFVDHLKEQLLRYESLHVRFSVDHWSVIEDDRWTMALSALSGLPHNIKEIYIEIDGNYRFTEKEYTAFNIFSVTKLAKEDAEDVITEDGVDKTIKVKRDVWPVKIVSNYRNPAQVSSTRKAFLDALLKLAPKRITIKGPMAYDLRYYLVTSFMPDWQCDLHALHQLGYNNMGRPMTKIKKIAAAEKEQMVTNWLGVVPIGDPPKQDGEDFGQTADRPDNGKQMPKWWIVPTGKAAFQRVGWKKEGTWDGPVPAECPCPSCNQRSKATEEVERGAAGVEKLGSRKYGEFLDTSGC